MRSSRLISGTAIAAVAVSLAAVPLGSATANGPKSSARPSVQAKTVDPDARAAQAAAEVVSARAPQLHLSPYDRVHAQPVLHSDDLRFVPYERTYKGLPVRGGDFVVVVDGDGNVVWTSVAQTAKVQLPDVTPSVSAATARARSASRVRQPSLGRSTLVVLQRGDRSDLAWETTASGVRAGQPSRLDVYVDADNGQVLSTLENVAAGDGQAAWSGPNPVPLATTLSGSTYSMATPGSPNLVCQAFNAANPLASPTFTGPDDHWGDGVSTTVETGCVDALYAAQQEKAMLKSWLGRSGMNGSGGWVPIRVGLDDLNAFYDGSEVQIGHNSSDEWIGSIDVVAHEFGHGIDDFTPGGISRKNTQEFVADTFGAATEAYDNQPTPYDQPDFLVGEQIDLVGTGPIRNMYDPSQVGDPNCWSSAIDGSSTEVHAGAGPGDHWFYLLAVGSDAPGQPTSPTCNGSSVTGVGIQKAMKIMYTAMLMKTTASSYKSYRQWTLVAARYLYGQSSCTEFNRVKAAWNAVSVPALTGEAKCTVGQASVSIADATSRILNAGTTITPFTLSASGGTGPYTWSATGLPGGLAINASTGQVSGSLTADKVGSYVVQVTATDSASRVGRAWFTLQVNGTSSTACSGQRFGNVGFENKIPAPWVMSAGSVYGPITGLNPHGGSHMAWIGGYGGDVTDPISQQAKIPAGCKATLTFWLDSSTQESGAYVYDTFVVKANSTVLRTYSNTSVTNAWVKQTIAVPASFAGKTVTFSFISDEDSSNATNWIVDDFGLTIAAP